MSRNGIGVAPSSGSGKPKVERGTCANASALNATLPLIMSRRLSWEFMTGIVIAVDQPVNSSSGQVWAQFGGARLLTSRRCYALARQVRLARMLAPPQDQLTHCLRVTLLTATM